MNRRQFLKTLSKTGMALGGAGLALTMPFFPGKTKKIQAVSFSDKLQKLTQNAPTARYWISSGAKDTNCLACHAGSENIRKENHRHESKPVKCVLCANECMIPNGETGACNTRINDDGVLKSLVYGRPVTYHVDPIEKKPFFHFLPGSSAFSIATAGCPLSCKFCQNWQISQARPGDFPVSFTPPDTVVSAAKKSKAPVIAYTYNEPTVFAEYLLDIATGAKTQGLKNVMVSCGYMQEEPLKDMCEVLDAVKIDLKGFSRDFYKNVCEAKLDPVLKTISTIAGKGVHLEIVNLVVPTLNDSTRMLKELSRWIAGETGVDTPVHFTRFHPDYRMLNLPPTPVDTLAKAWDIAKNEGLRYPYVGNAPGHPGNNTYCPSCGKTVIRRVGFFVTQNRISGGQCPNCGTPLAGVWS